MLNKRKGALIKKEIAEDKQNLEFEKGDFLALLIAAASVMFPVLLLIFAAIALLVWIIF
ncbi:MAG: hypothetical protein K0Q99_466 [Clostridia bacterium]|jgi:hypothetical protein|nr:hypothetical protein [Clostridia bacterium]